LLKVFDVDKKQTIEFLQRMSSISSHTSLEEKARIDFKIYDLGGNGFIEKYSETENSKTKQMVLLLLDKRFF
jgi:Ca2+-binding EF-hand superfamily protein